MNSYKLTLTEYNHLSRSSNIILIDLLRKMTKELGKEPNNQNFGAMYENNDDFPKAYYIKTNDKEILNYLIRYYNIEPAQHPSPSPLVIPKIRYSFTGNANLFYS